MLKMMLITNVWNRGINQTLHARGDVNVGGNC